MSFQRWTRVTKICLAVLIALTCTEKMAEAKDGWDFAMGGGVYSSNVYVGSEDYYITPFPTVEAVYGMDDVSLSLSLLNGIGVTYFNQENGLIGDITLTSGEERDSEEYSVLWIAKDHSERTKRLLADSPKVSTPIVVNGMIGYQVLNGIIGANIGYHLIDVDYTLAGQKDPDYQGILFSLFYSVERSMTETLSFKAMLGVEYMNQDYADAWYSISQATAELDLFDADAGLRDAMFSIGVTRMFSAHTGVSLLGAGTLLLADAGRSPYTVERFQPSTMLTAFYSFK